MILDHHTIVFGLVAILLFLLIARSLTRWSAAAGNSFDLRDLFMENGRASKGAVVLLGAFAATTWFFVFYAATGRMTEGYFGIYGALWIAPVVARMISNPPAEAKAAP